MNETLFNYIAGISSVVSLVITSFTLWQVGSLKKSQKEHNRKIVFNNTAENKLFFIMEINDKFKTSIHNKKDEEIKDLLFSIKTQLEIFNDIIPKKHHDHKSSCQQILKSIRKLYRCKYVMEKERIFNLDSFWRYNASYSKLLSTHRNINSWTQKIFEVLETKDFTI